MTRTGSVSLAEQAPRIDEQLTIVAMALASAPLRVQWYATTGSKVEAMAAAAPWAQMTRLTEARSAMAAPSARQEPLHEMTPAKAERRPSLHGMALWPVLTLWIVWRAVDAKRFSAQLNEKINWTSAKEHVLGGPSSPSCGFPKAERLVLYRLHPAELESTLTLL
jgi:hypothetical protein